MTDTYILLRDLPYIKAGVEYVSADGFNGVFDRCSYVPNKLGMMHERFAIHIDWIKDNPDWFRKKEEPKERNNIPAEMFYQRSMNNAYPNPTEKDISSPEFNAVWEAIKGWDIQRQKGLGYSGASGSDVMHILEGLRKIHKSNSQPPSEPDTFFWTDELVEQYARIREVEYKMPHLKFNKTTIGEFKQSKSTPKAEMIFGVRFYDENGNASGHEFIQFPKSKKIAIKKAIENELNK